tara:strand:+ start:47629 stop:48426 length:798 start_codon:yes stop_codon:yes gene_type:complete
MHNVLVTNLLRNIGVGLTKQIVQFAAILAGLTIFANAALPDTTAKNKNNKSVIEEIVRGYLLENPEVIEEAIQILRARRQAEEENLARLALSKNREALRHHPMTPVSGNLNGDITVVEFFDYQCGYCKRTLTSIIELLQSDKKVRVVWKELPILGPGSRIAARAAMAANKQARYLDLHIAIMRERGRLSENKIMAAAKNLGLDIDKLRHDMKDPAIDAYLDETKQLANKLGIRGTPALIIEGTIVPGAIDTADIKRIIAQFRAGG